MSAGEVKTVRVWHGENCVKTLEGHTDRVHGVARSGPCDAVHEWRRMGEAPTLAEDPVVRVPVAVSRERELRLRARDGPGHREHREHPESPMSCHSCRKRSVRDRV